MKRALLLLLVSCVHVPRIPPALRTTGQQYDLAVAIESLCAAPEPPLRNPAPVFPVQPWEPVGKLGSGVLVDGRHALTAAHVVACPFLPTVRMVLADGRAFRMAVEWQNAKRDLARLVIASAEVLPIVPPVIGHAEVDDVVCSAVTMPARQMNCGVVEAIHYSERANIGMTALTQLGNSGAGVYNARGELVGIVSSLSKDQLTGFATAIAKTGAMP